LRKFGRLRGFRWFRKNPAIFPSHVVILNEVKNLLSNEVRGCSYADSSFVGMTTRGMEVDDLLFDGAST
jgi:hypothetical protein